MLQAVKTIRDQLEGGEEARVEVNQRALIDKVLARYSGEFTLFRELLQNADDAGSSTVEIHFETTVYQRCAREENTRPSMVDLKLTDVEVPTGGLAFIPVLTL
jgi:hypothetical protein